MLSKNNPRNRKGLARKRMLDGKEVKTLKVSRLTGNGMKRSVYIGGFVEGPGGVPQTVQDANGIPTPYGKIGALEWV